MKMLKKCLLLLCFTIFFASYSFADDSIEEPLESLEIFETSGIATKEPITNSKHIIVLDRKTLSVLYEKDAYSKTAMASTTKIMTCILALENLSVDSTITVSKEASRIHGSTLGLHENDKITISDLLYGLMLRSRKRWLGKLMTGIYILNFKLIWKSLFLSIEIFSINSSITS